VPLLRSRTVTSTPGRGRSAATCVTAVLAPRPMLADTCVRFILVIILWKSHGPSGDGVELYSRLTRVHQFRPCLGSRQRHSLHPAMEEKAREDLALPVSTQRHGAMDYPHLWTLGAGLSFFFFVSLSCSPSLLPIVPSRIWSRDTPYA
jgi:hypothetical protein